MHPSFATRLNLDLLEQNYERWRKDPDSLDSGWSAFFEGFELGSLDGKNGAGVEPDRAEGWRELRESPLQTRIDARLERTFTQLTPPFSPIRFNPCAIFAIKAAELKSLKKRRPTGIERIGIFAPTLVILLKQIEIQASGE